jgi:hypothetical protein
MRVWVCASDDKIMVAYDDAHFIDKVSSAVGFSLLLKSRGFKRGDIINRLSSCDFPEESGCSEDFDPHSIIDEGVALLGFSHSSMVGNMVQSRQYC